MTHSQPQLGIGTWLNIAGLSITLFGLLVGGLWYIAHLDARLSAVESARISDSSEVLSCAQVATKIADAYRTGDARNVAEPLERLMDRMGCGAPSPTARG